MSAKPDVRMSRDDIRAFVASQDIAFVCLRDAQGRLIAKPCRYKADDGDLVLASPPESENDAQACAIIDTYPSYDKIVGVMLRGTSHLVADGARLSVAAASGFDFSKAPKPEGA
jgi:hypothetical protein